MGRAGDPAPCCARVTSLALFDDGAFESAFRPWLIRNFSRTVTEVSGKTKFWSFSKADIGACQKIFSPARVYVREAPYLIPSEAGSGANTQHTTPR